MSLSKAIGDRQTVALGLSAFGLGAHGSVRILKAVFFPQHQTLDDLLYTRIQRLLLGSAELTLGICSFIWPARTCFAVAAAMGGAALSQLILLGGVGTLSLMLDGSRALEWLSHVATVQLGQVGLKMVRSPHSRPTSRVIVGSAECTLCIIVLRIVFSSDLSCQDREPVKSRPCVPPWCHHQVLSSRLWLGSVV